MSTVYLLDALCILVVGMTALFAFGLSGFRQRTAFKVIFFLSLALLLFTLWFGHWLGPQGQSAVPEVK
jgi:hypothetical protein